MSTWGWKDGDDRALEFPDETTPSPAPAKGPGVEGRGRIIYQNDSQLFKQSTNGSDYTPLGAGAPGAGLVSDWFIDPVNGDDSADGKSASAAIATHEELRARIGDQLIDTTMTVHLLEDFDASNPVYIDFRLGPNGLLRYVGEKTLTVVDSGVLGPGTADLSRAANTATQLDGVAPAAINALGSPMARITVNGGIGYCCADLGGGILRSSPLNLPLDVGPAVPPQFRRIIPAPGDSYVVETGFTQVASLQVDLKLVGEDPAFTIKMAIKDIELADVDAHRARVFASTGAEGVGTVIFSGCNTAGLINLGGAIAMDGCLISQTATNTVSMAGGYTTVENSLVLVILGIGLEQPDSALTVIEDTVFQGPGRISSIGGKFSGGSFAVFDSPTDAVRHVGGQAVYNPFITTPAGIYGSGNAGSGIFARNATSVLYVDPGGGAAAAGFSINLGATELTVGTVVSTWAAAAPDVIDATKLSIFSAF